VRASVLLVAVLAALAVDASPAAAASTPAPAWAPDVAGAIRYAQGRHTVVSFAVRTDGRLYGWRVNWDRKSASLVKAMLLVAYLDQPSVRNRALTAADRRLLAPMIQVSDNAAATRVYRIVGATGLRRVAQRAGMTRFTPRPAWGTSLITAADQSSLFLSIDALMPPRHRAYGMSLLGSIVPAQRWGVARAVPPGFSLFFKSGWYPDPAGWREHQGALLLSANQRVSLAILTVGSPTHLYATQTLQGVAARLLRGLGATGTAPATPPAARAATLAPVSPIAPPGG
jgi:hypothetical protein